MKNSSIMVRTMITAIINRLVLFNVPTKSSIGVNVITCQGWPKPPGKLANAAIKSSPLMGDWKRKSVGTGASVLAMSFAHHGIVDIGQGCDLERPRSRYERLSVCPGRQ